MFTSPNVIVPFQIERGMPHGVPAPRTDQPRTLRCVRRLLALSVLVLAAVAAAPADAALTRYSLANRCLALVPGAAPLSFKPTGLGTYLLARADGRLVATSGATVADPGPDAEWAANVRRGRLQLRSTATGELLRRFRPRRAHGCRAYPEAQLNAR